MHGDIPSFVSTFTSYFGMKVNILIPCVQDGKYHRTYTCEAFIIFGEQYCFNNATNF